MKSYKYLVIEEQGYDDDILAVADAQEFILSCLEAEIYEDFYYLIFGESLTTYRIEKIPYLEG